MIPSVLHYPHEDVPQQTQLNLLFERLKRDLADTITSTGRTSSDVVLDGFFPNYSKQVYKVLFVGRESLDLTGLNYIDTIHACYTQNLAIGEKSLNQSRFHSLMIYLVYALNNGCPKWADIPMANEIATTFATEKGISFAFMNYSKFSNESENWQADWNLIASYEKALKGLTTNYFGEQIDILQPNVILTMNLEEKLSRFGKLYPIEYRDNASYYRLKIKQRAYLLIDLFHFSALKDMETCFYLPVLEGIEKYGMRS